jgi:hypothetical protein
VEEAKAEFVRFRGRQFDPTICDRILEEAVWAEIYRSYVAPQDSASTTVKAS